MELFILILEIVGTVSFALSGAMTGLKKNMDIFGVCVLGVTTAVGGGILRDLLLGLTPPATFLDPKYVLMSIVTSLFVFSPVVRRVLFHSRKLYDALMLISDSAGLGIFTVYGARVAIGAGYEENLFLVLFVAVAIFAPSNQDKYDQAVTLVTEGEYDKATELLTELADYEDSQAILSYVQCAERAKTCSGSDWAALNATLGDLKLDAKELQKPGRDPRDDLPKPVLRTDVLAMEDLAPGMELMGTVRNVIDFGAFVDVGVHQDGLVHISRMSNRFIKHPAEVVKVGDVIKVWVVEVDAKKKRIALTMHPPKA